MLTLCDGLPFDEPFLLTNRILVIIRQGQLVTQRLIRGRKKEENKGGRGNCK